MSYFENLAGSAQLAALSKTEFVTLCQLHDGLVTADAVAAKNLLLGTIGTAIAEQDDFRRDIADRTFPGDTPETRAAFIKELDGEREHFVHLLALVEGLDEQACAALLRRIEEVYASEGEHIYDRCRAVFQKLQVRNRLS